MKKTFLFVFIWGVASMLFIACNKEDDDNKSSTMAIPTKSLSCDGKMRLGERITDPYKYENMVVAFNQLRQEGIVFPFHTLPVSGKYVRVLITNDSLEGGLDSANTIEWYDFPLDYELPEGGLYYTDNTLPDTVKWKYGVVPTNYTFPSGLMYQEIYNVLIPDEMRISVSQQHYFDMIETRSLLLCGMMDDREMLVSAEMDDIQDTSNIRSGGWYPSATIKAWDDVINGYVNLQGVKVVAKCGTSTKNYAITSAQGQCTMGKVKTNKKITYIVRWERNDWKIRNSIKKDLVYIGPTVRNQNWVWNIGSEHRYMVNVATIHRAAVKAFFGYFGGLQRPKAWGKLLFQYDDWFSSDPEMGHNICGWNILGLISNIVIYGRSSSEGHSRYDTEKVFGTAIHEMGHQSMLKFEGGSYQYFQHNKFIRESWASCVEWFISNDYYTNDLGLSHTYYRDRQDWTRESMSSIYPNQHNPYTPVFIDMIDNYNQHNSNSSYCIDNVSGYLISEIQNTILGTSFGLTSLRTTLQSHLFHGTTYEAANELLDNYSSIGF